MDFDEALRRFIKTDPRELRGDTAMATGGGATQMLTWSKKLSQTDAQQPTSGGIVPYLRLIRGSLGKENFQTWFRTNFFDNLAWKPGSVGQETGVEVADVTFDVTLNGVNIGQYTLMVSHGPNRQVNNNTPNTWLHWGPLQPILSKNNFTGRRALLTRRPDGTYSLAI
ncbi:MAG: hypothetical protein INF91_04795 [Alphaproteobacteria bacterium]|nr:hypothetical protein [Alphaproteobacteria bacterium]